jgi:hypothetical protein
MKTTLVLVLLAMSACGAHQDLNTPCKDYGKYCQQERLNGWD